jgi:hypothetical protein
VKVASVTGVELNPTVKTSYIALTQTQIDLVAEAIDVAASEHARFLEDDARHDFARVLRVMGKQREASLIEPE